MLADTYIPQVAAGPAAVGILAVAVIIEVPLAALAWRPHVLRAICWVCVANLISTLFGAIPVFLSWWMWAPGMDVDPWEVYHNEVYRRLWLLLPMFFATLAIEGLVYIILNLPCSKRIGARRLLLGLLLGNIASYVFLAGYVATQDYGPGDFEFRSDTAWLGPCDERVWFFDSNTCQLCSIQLDGTGRRVEVAEPLGRFNQVLRDVSLYAIIPDRNEILFLGKDHKWHVSGPAGARTLQCQVAPWDPSYGYCWDVPDLLRPALKELFGETGPWPRLWSNLTPREVHPFHAWDESPKHQLEATTYMQDGSGEGLELTTGAISKFFGVHAGIAYLGCREPSILPERDLIVFRCGGWIMVLDPKTERVGRLCRGDSLVVLAPVFDYARGVQNSGAGPSGPSR